LLACFLEEPFFDLAPPKSTGRDLFDARWLDQALARYGVELAHQDVQATLVELTAGQVAACVLRHSGVAREVLVCGGGARNTQLMRRLAVLLPGAVVQPTDARGLAAEQVEAAAFAWLAKAFGERRAGNLVSVTGAAAPRVLGALYPG
jgi:anhydro-N-acetylmuramic acid kinase